MDTDAEGRLILADALAEANSERPALLIDRATLTGVARAALGTELPALFATDDTWLPTSFAMATGRLIRCGGCRCTGGGGGGGLPAPSR